MADETVRLAMWSGPRNISTAMMRSWENRPDSAVVDEPLYAAYLARTGLDHPARDEVIAAGETDWRRVVDRLSGPAPDGAPVFYAKHMTHHLLPDYGLDWVRRFRTVLLIRDPRLVVASYVKSRESVTPDDIGVPQQVRLFEHLATLGEPPPIIDSDDFLRDPRGHLEWLCDWAGLAFTDRMLAWPAGPRDSDGVWAPHWYDAVWRSTGFEPWQPRQVSLADAEEAVAAACREGYQTLREGRVRL